MIHAGSNFSHIMAHRKAEGHVLVTSGIYRLEPTSITGDMLLMSRLVSYLRHPSYTGFFYWALGTQLVLQNPLSFVLYLCILWRFFYQRIRGSSCC